MLHNQENSSFTWPEIPIFYSLSSYPKEFWKRSLSQSIGNYVQKRVFHFISQFLSPTTEQSLTRFPKSFGVIKKKIGIQTIKIFPPIYF